VDEANGDIKYIPEEAGAETAPLQRFVRHSSYRKPSPVGEGGPFTVDEANGDIKYIPEEAGAETAPLQRFVRHSPYRQPSPVGEGGGEADG